VDFPIAVKRKKSVILSAALASLVITLIGLFAAESSNSVILFVFLEPVVLACVMPFLLGYRRDAESHRARILRPLSDAAVFCAFLAAGAVIISASKETGEPILSTLFFIPFALFIAAITTLFCLLFGLHSGQIAGATVSTLIIATPFYISYILKIIPAADARLFAVQSAVSINPLIVASAPILQFDWLRSPRMYSLCPIGGEQYPFYYPSCVKVALIYLLCALLLTGVAYLLSRKVHKKGTEKYG